MIKLSIIIPAYNVENYIKQCVESCLRQDVPIEEYEIIIVDDGSRDNTLDIVNEIASKHNNIQVISQNNKGPGGARNEGLSISSGKYIWFVDSDDYIEYDILKKIINLTSNDYDVIELGWAFLYEHSQQIKSQLQNVSIKNGIEVLKNAQYPMGPQFYIYKRMFLEKYHLEFIENIYHEDNEFTPKMLYFADKCIYINQICYYYRIREIGDIISTPNIKKSYDLIFVAKKLLEFTKINVRSNDRYIFYRLIGVALNYSIRNIKEHSILDRKNFYMELSKNVFLFNTLLLSKSSKYIIEAILCKISLLLYYKSVTHI